MSFIIAAVAFIIGTLFGALIISLAMAAGRADRRLEEINSYGQGNVRVLPQDDREEGR